METLENKLRQILSNLNLVHDLQSIQKDTDLFAMGALDSLVLVQYILSLEDQFKITIPNTEITMDHFKTLERQMNYLTSRFPELSGQTDAAS